MQQLWADAMTIGSDEITMGNPNLFMVLAIAFIAMLPLYQLIGKRILYNKHKRMMSLPYSSTS